MITSARNFTYPSVLRGSLRCIFMVERSQALPLLTLYPDVSRVLADLAGIVAALLVASYFLCLFLGKYFYFITGEMHIC